MNDDELLNLFNDIKEEVEGALRVVEWAEEEIDAAKLRHPDAADRLDQGFPLLDPTSDLLIRAEFTYRSHCREILDRVAAGQDTRPGTAAECCCALSEISFQVPFNTAAAGLYARMWKLADMPPLNELTDNNVHYEALESARIDEMEAWLRRKLRKERRVLGSSR